MNSRSSELSLRQITIAFATTESHQTLEVVTALAASLNAEVAGVFIEDADMLRAVSLPFALEFSHSTNRIRRADSSIIERELKERAELVRGIVTDAARRMGREWTFRVIRRGTSAALHELSQTTDVVVYSPNTLYRRRRQSFQHPTNAREIIVLLDGSLTDTKTLLLAGQLADLNRHNLHMLAIGESQSAADEIVNRTHRESRRHPQRVQTLCSPTIAELVKVIKVSNPSAVIVPSALVSSSSEQIRAFEDVIDSPIIIVN